MVAMVLSQPVFMVKAGSLPIADEIAKVHDWLANLAFADGEGQIVARQPAFVPCQRVESGVTVTVAAARHCGKPVGFVCPYPDDAVRE
jgi:hypothetical protein